MAGNQLGKAQPIDEPVLTPRGWRPIGALRVGDAIIAGDGSRTKVTGVFPQGTKPVFRVVFDDGAETRCCEEHLWAARLRKPERFGDARADRLTWPTYSLAQIRQWGGDNPIPVKRAVIPVAEQCELETKGIPVDPYLLGALLGDGTLRNGNIYLASADEELLAAVRAAIPAECELIATGRGCDYRISVRQLERSVVNGRWLPTSSLKMSLVQLGVYGCLAAQKHVPEIYLWNDNSVRLAVLQGLLDTDGSISTDGAIEFSTVSDRLADDVTFLARSFGGKVKRQRRITHYTYLGERRAGQPSWRLRIRLPHIAPFRLSRKIARLHRPVSTTDWRVLYQIEPAGEAKCVCISVDHPSRTYVTRDFIVTHNTIAGGAEWAMHLTGRYPDWWEGATFNKAVTLWASGVTSESTRDNPQRILVGPPPKVEEWGTGMIPKDALGSTARAMGVTGLLDNAIVKWGGGGDVQQGESLLYFKSYEKGREKWQGPTIDGVWFDEEPPLEIYTEGLTRTNNGQRGQFCAITFTPMNGMTEVVRMFLTPEQVEMMTR